MRTLLHPSRYGARAGFGTPAFSLLELVLVIAIIGILATIAVPRLGNSITFQSVEGAARRIAADFELARRHAMTASTSQTIRAVKGTDPGYVLVGLPHPDHPAEEYGVSLRRDCFGAELVAVDFGADGELTFDMYGMPDRAARLVIRVGDHYWSITVEQTTGELTVRGIGEAEALLAAGLPGGLDLAK